MVERINWLRAAVLGANDGIISTGSLIVGVAAATALKQDMMISGVAGLERERRELEGYPAGKLTQLTKIYEAPGLTQDLAHQVAVQLTKHDALGAHMRDELNISEFTVARPVEAALASGVSFAVGASFPLIVALLAPRGREIAAVAVTTIFSLACLGGLGTRVGGSGTVSGATRVVFWGALAMATTAAAAVGKVFGTIL